MTYDVFGGTLSLTQSIVSEYADVYNVALSTDYRSCQDGTDELSDSNDGWLQLQSLYCVYGDRCFVLQVIVEL